MNSTHTYERTYEEEVKGRLDDLSDQIKKLAARADEAKADTKAKYQSTIRDLEKRRDAVQAKLDELQSSGSNAFDDFKSGLDEAMDELTKAVDTATSRFKN